MPSDRNDFSGPIEDRVAWEEFSKDFLLKVMRLWQEQWEAFTNVIVGVGAAMDGVGATKASEMVYRTMEIVAPPIFARMADLAGVDASTVEGRLKAGGLSMDNMYDHYPGHYEVKGPGEVILTYTECAVLKKFIGKCDINWLHHVCREVEPRYARTMINYPGERRIKVELLKVPDSVENRPGEPICVWRFTFDDEPQ